MIRTSLADCASAVGGRLLAGDPAAMVTGVVTVDSRAVGPGDLFVAVAGGRVDGHDYVSAAVAAGAVAVLVQREVALERVAVQEPTLQEPTTPTAGVVLVPDTTVALADLARAVHVRLRAGGTRTVAVTGSAGKTTTKDLLAELLRSDGEDDAVRVVATRGSYNNEIGLPLTVLAASEDTAVLVLEMGARAVGHLAHLTGIARPDVAVVLCVGSAHVGEFGSVEAIAAAKGELVDALVADDPTSVAVLNADDPAVAAMAARTRARVVGFGESAGALVRAEEVDVDSDARLRLTLRSEHPRAVGSVAVRTRLVGEQHLPNVLAAAAVALELGVGLRRVADVLERAGAASPHRMQVTDRDDGVRVVDDAYNANPESTAAALRALAQMGRARAAAGGRSWAVLGEMLELGPLSREAHDRIGRLAVRLNVDRLVVVGAGALPMHAAAQHEGSWGEESVHVPDIPAARSLLAAQLRPGDVVLLKASNGVGLWRLAQELATTPAAAAS